MDSLLIEAEGEAMTTDASLNPKQSTEEMEPTVELLPVAFHELMTGKDEEMDFIHDEVAQMDSAPRCLAMDRKVENCGNVVFWDSESMPETLLSKEEAYEEADSYHNGICCHFTVAMGSATLKVQTGPGSHAWPEGQPRVPLHCSRQAEGCRGRRLGEEETTRQPCTQACEGPGDGEAHVSRSLEHRHGFSLENQAEVGFEELRCRPRSRSALIPGVCHLPCSSWEQTCSPPCLLQSPEIPVMAARAGSRLRGAVAGSVLSHPRRTWTALQIRPCTPRALKTQRLHLPASRARGQSERLVFCEAPGGAGSGGTEGAEIREALGAPGAWQDRVFKVTRVTRLRFCTRRLVTHAFPRQGP
ncbi:hypothetical protein H920_04721 [Fukomys damarensis]|uniref:Uncharacterized protein n=1 Tax=Fukomys damarensis TaxID=885580 RepID=A0A091DRN9_FUKDA|nr:hypothetical protein H920_04721 [Fukomys damarensis]